LLDHAPVVYQSLNRPAPCGYTVRMSRLPWLIAGTALVVVPQMVNRASACIRLTTCVCAVFWFASLARGADQPAPPGGALAGDRPRVIVSTDVGGSDPDDFQSLVHLLLYADVLDIEGLISSPPQHGRVQHIHEVLDAYAKDYPNLKRRSSGYPAPDVLRKVARQGAVDAAPPSGWSRPTAGSQWIIDAAQANDPRPLWVLVWGSMTDVAQAVHDDPAIKSKVRVYSIGSWNTHQDRAARDYLFKHHADLWWIENDATFRGMYVGGFQNGQWGNLAFVAKSLRGHGALGDFFFRKKRDLKMGDTPSLLFLLRGDAEDPASAHWGGAFVKSEHGPHYWTDNPDRSLSEGGYAGAKTVNRWRVDYLADWQRRMTSPAKP